MKKVKYIHFDDKNDPELLKLANDLAKKEGLTVSAAIRRHLLSTLK